MTTNYRNFILPVTLIVTVLAGMSSLIIYRNNYTSTFYPFIAAITSAAVIFFFYLIIRSLIVLNDPYKLKKTLSQVNRTNLRSLKYDR
jgi:hypothetical protein